MINTYLPIEKPQADEVSQADPDVLLEPSAAEIVDTPEKVKPYMQGDEFDGEMNYNFAFACAEFFFNRDINVSEFDKKLDEKLENFEE